MKTIPQNRTEDETKRLFQQLFEVQYELEGYFDRSNALVQLIIRMIDDLLEILLLDEND